MKLNKIATISLILLGSIIVALPSCGEMSPNKIHKSEIQMNRERVLSADTLTMPDGHVYFYSVGSYWSSMCHAEGYCKKHK